jgi:NADP-dependent alcohol dehydrogenase
VKAVTIVKEQNIDFILAVGGSVIDGVKFISGAVNYSGDPMRFYKNEF